MALPSAVTVASVTVVVAAGIGLAAAATRAADNPAADHGPAHPVVSAPIRHQPKATPGEHRAQAKPRHKHHDALPKVLVEVYNNSGITGLASNRAAVLEGAGWKVAATSNWNGDIPANTVYFPDGLRAEAKQLAEVLSINRLRPAVAPMQFDRLTVILASS